MKTKAAQIFFSFKLLFIVNLLMPLSWQTLQASYLEEGEHIIDLMRQFESIADSTDENIKSMVEENFDEDVSPAEVSKTLGFSRKALMGVLVSIGSTAYSAYNCKDSKVKHDHLNELHNLKGSFQKECEANPEWSKSNQALEWLCKKCDEIFTRSGVNPNDHYKKCVLSGIKSPKKDMPIPQEDQLQYNIDRIKQEAYDQVQMKVAMADAVSLGFMIHSLVSSYNDFHKLSDTANNNEQLLIQTLKKVPKLIPSFLELAATKNFAYYEDFFRKKVALIRKIETIKAEFSTTLNNINSQASSADSKKQTAMSNAVGQAIQGIFSIYNASTTPTSLWLKPLGLFCGAGKVAVAIGECDLSFRCHELASRLMNTFRKFKPHERDFDTLNDSIEGF